MENKATSWSKEALQKYRIKEGKKESKFSFKVNVQGTIEEVGCQT